jgi:hypothetical protein
MWWNERQGKGCRSKCEEDEGTDCGIEKKTLIGKGRQNLTYFVY